MASRSFVSKHCKTLQEAEKRQDQLYDEYEEVRLIEFPRFVEEGIYLWSCKGPKS